MIWALNAPIAVIDRVSSGAVVRQWMTTLPCGQWRHGEQDRLISHYDKTLHGRIGRTELGREMSTVSRQIFHCIFARKSLADFNFIHRGVVIRWSLLQTAVIQAAIPCQMKLETSIKTVLKCFRIISIFFIEDEIMHIGLERFRNCFVKYFKFHFT